MAGRSVGFERAVSTLIYDRLDPAMAAELERRVAAQPELQLPPPDDQDPTERLPLLLSYGMWLEVPGVAEQTGLSEVQPPEEIHTMARGPLAAAGGLYEADMAVDALRAAGGGLEEVRAALDFGCSSGRVLRVLSAAYPSVRWSGCDPNEPAIRWGAQHLPGIEFFVSANEPPLNLADGSLDLASAFSIWSHFAPSLGCQWFEEMRRLLRPGGRLVWTAHGFESVSHYVSSGVRTPKQAQEIAAALYHRGWWYAAEFGQQGDWGVVNDAWGTAFLSPEWVLAHLTPAWRIEEFSPGRYQGNQDLYVMQRR
jgi:SAM-dependent methyltransferase